MLFPFFLFLVLVRLLDWGTRSRTVVPLLCVS